MYVSIMESGRAEVIAVLEAPRIFVHSSQDHLVVKSDSMNVLSWIEFSAVPPWEISVSILMKSNICHF